MSVPPASPRSGDCGTFLLQRGTFVVGVNPGLTSVARGLAQMGVNCALLTEVKITKNKYPKYTLGYKILSLHHNQGGVALL